MVCMERPRDHVLIPCGHVLVCGDWCVRRPAAWHLSLAFLMFLLFLGYCSFSSATGGLKSSSPACLPSLCCPISVETLSQDAARRRGGGSSTAAVNGGAAAEHGGQMLCPICRELVVSAGTEDPTVNCCSAAAVWER